MNDQPSANERFIAAVQQLGNDLLPFFEAMSRAFQDVAYALGPLYPHLKRIGVIPRDMPPQHAYRQTHRGRVPRLTPAMRERQRELRKRGGRR